MTERRFRRRMERLPRSVRRLVRIGESPSDSEELRVRKEVLVLSTVLMAGLAMSGSSTYALLGLWVSAAIPFAYQVASAASIWSFSRTQRFGAVPRQPAPDEPAAAVRAAVEPRRLRERLGGLPVGLHVAARSAADRRRAGERPWFAAFVALVVASAAIDSTLAAGAPEIPQRPRHRVLRAQRPRRGGDGVRAAAVLRARARAGATPKSERLLLNVLPGPSAQRGSRRTTGSSPTTSPTSPCCSPTSSASPRCRSGSRAARWSRCSTGCSRASTSSSPSTASRRSRRSATPTWSPAASRCRAPITPRRSPSWRSRWDPQLAALRGRDGRAARRSASASTPARSSPASSAARSSSTTCGATPSTPPAAWSRTRLPGTIQVTERAYERLRDRFELRRRGIVDIKGKGPMECYVLTGPLPPAVSPAARSGGQSRPARGC